MPGPQNKRSNTSGSAPTALSVGELAINQADDVIYSQKPDGSIRRFLLPKRVGVANVAYPVKAWDTAIGIASLTASRTITLPLAASYPAGHPLTIYDESGAVTASITVGLAQAAGSSDTINGATNLLFTTPYFGATLFSDGVSKWTAIGLAAGGSGSALLYTPQTLTAAQQRQTLTNLALLHANFRMTEIRAATPSYFGLVDGIADNFLDNGGIDTANAQNATVFNGTVVNFVADVYTKLLAHFDTSLTADDAGHAGTVTGAPTISTAIKKFGAGSLAVNGSSYVSFANSNNDFALAAAGPWTIECWVYPTSLPGGTNYSIIVSPGAFNLSQNGTALNFDNSSAQSQSYSGALTVGAWSKIEVTNSGGTVYVFVNGNLLGSAAAQSYGSISNIQVGGANTNNGFNGYIDEVRFSKGIARHTASYTPETAPFAVGTPGVMVLPSVNYNLSSGVPTKGSIFIRAKATADVISPNTNFIASLSRNGTLGGSNSLDVTLAATAVLPDGYTHYEANEVDLTGLTSGSVLKGSLRTVDTSLSVAIDGWRIRAA